MPKPGSCDGSIHTVLERRAKRTSTDLPTGAVNGTLVQGNVFFLGDEVSGVINFRLRHEDAPASELADVLVGWAGEATGSMSKERPRALLQVIRERDA